MKKVTLLVFSLFLVAQVTAQTQTGEFRLSQSVKSGIYAKGEKISVYIFPGGSSDSIRVSVMKNNKDVIVRKSIVNQGDSTLIFDGSFKEPCSLITDVRVGMASVSIGMLVEPNKLKPGAKTPDDFNTYWDREKLALHDLKFEVKSVPVEAKQQSDGFVCSDIEINCTGPAPARGYYAKPATAAPHSLPAVLLVHAAGVKGSWCRSEPGNALDYARKGAICFDLNAHGMLNGQPESYYAGLENGELKNYFLKGLTNREDFYFRGMYLRLLRTIEFLTMQPEWDGKRILVIGESQGGGQALAAAGLDNRVSAVVAIVPAMCDFMGALAGRRGGWPQPFETDASKEEMKNVLPYFDDANLLKRSKAIIFCEIGMIDLTCPPASVFAAVNQAKGKKIIYPVPYRGHQTGAFTMSNNKIWQATVYKPREEFINNYLK